MQYIFYILRLFHFCYFTNFGSFKFAVANFINSILYFDKSVIYLRDLKFLQNSFFQVRFTLISNSSNCKNCIQFYFIIPFVSRQNRFEVENFCHFFSKKSLSFPWNTPKSITTSEFVAYESIKACCFVLWFVSFESIICFVLRNPGTEIIRLISDYYYYFLVILVLGLINGSPQYNDEQWAISKQRDLQYVHININSLLPKIDELRCITKLSEVIDTSE